VQHAGLAYLLALAAAQPRQQQQGQATPHREQATLEPALSSNSSSS
jgi:hypothetical protein